VLPARHADYGDTPRAIGGLSAIGQGFDAIAYLDADNWYARDHIASLIALHEHTGAAICTARRSIHHLDGRQLGFQLYSDECDTSCLMLFRPAFQIAPAWALIADDEHVIGDLIISYGIAKLGLSRADSGRYTVAYTAIHAAAYHLFGWPVPDGANAKNTGITEARTKWISEGYPPFPPKRFACTAKNNNDRGLAWAALDLHDKALEAFDKAIEQESGYIEAHNNRGSALVKLSRYQEALSSFQRVLAIDPNHTVARDNLTLLSSL
jgi:tetratricopeptide (TPR) repeat protein